MTVFTRLYKQSNAKTVLKPCTNIVNIAHDNIKTQSQKSQTEESFK